MDREVSFVYLSKGVVSKCESVHARSYKGKDLFSLRISNKTEILNLLMNKQMLKSKSAMFEGGSLSGSSSNCYILNR